MRELNSTEVKQVSGGALSISINYLNDYSLQNYSRKTVLGGPGAFGGVASGPASQTWFARSASTTSNIAAGTGGGGAGLMSSFVEAESE